jgi:hypothetical protein
VDTAAVLASWCRQWFGAQPQEILFEHRQLSHVIGVRLDNQRVIVVKARPASARLDACARVQQHLWTRGYPCPELLAGPAPFGDLVATAEAYLPGGELLPRSAGAAQKFAAALAHLVALAPAPEAFPSLAPAPPWVGWEHEQPGIWPLPDTLNVNLNHIPGPVWLDELGQALRAILCATRLPAVVGHADWESQNLRWRDGVLLAVHDWDSVVALPEATLAGAAAAVFPADREPLSDATVAESAAFLSAYAHARGYGWSLEEQRLGWAAGLWVRAFNAKKAFVRDPASPVVARLEEEVGERRVRAGL